MPIVSPRYDATQYDGTNGTQVAAELAGTEIKSDTDGVLTMVVNRPHTGPMDYEITAGTWIVRRGDQLFTLCAPDEYAANWTEITPA